MNDDKPAVRRGATTITDRWPYPECAAQRNAEAVTGLDARATI